MTWERARLAMAGGKSVRRSAWCSSLKCERGKIVWNLDAKTLRSCSYSGKNQDPSYEEWPLDLESSDWEIAA